MVLNHIKEAQSAYGQCADYMVRCRIGRRIDHGAFPDRYFSTRRHRNERQRTVVYGGKKGMTSNDTEIESELQPRRRTLLGMIAAAGGLLGSTGTTTAQLGDDVEPRPCDDSHLFQPGDW